METDVTYISDIKSPKAGARGSKHLPGSQTILLNPVLKHVFLTKTKMGARPGLHGFARVAT